MRDGNHSSLVLLQMGFQPLDGFSVKMVGGLVQKKHVRFLQKQAAKRHAAAFTSGEFLYLLLRRRALQCIHSPFQLGVYLPAAFMVYEFSEFSLTFNETVHLIVVHGLHELHGYLVVLLKDVHYLLNTLLDHFQHGFFRIHLRLLLQISNGIAGRPDHFALVGFLYAGDDLEQRRFSGTVKADDADFGAVEEGEVDILQDYFVVVGQDLAYAVHREDYGFVCHDG